jgi:hypothetical protein
MGSIYGKGEDAPVHVMNTYRGNKGIALLIHNLDTKCRLVVSFMPQSLYLQYPLNGRLDKPHNSLDVLEKR